MLHYRTFRNTDPPRLVELWNQIMVGPGAVHFTGTSLLEFHLFGKPYFDPEGLLFGFDDEQAVGFTHAGFGPNSSETGLAMTPGIICVLGVIPAFRRRGIGTELLRRSEDYLRAKGSQVVYCGATFRRNPFYLGLYGGCNSSGILASDTEVGTFLERRGYQAVETFELWERRLDGPITVTDWRFPGHRRTYEIRITPRSGIGSWWRECVEGPLELVEFRLEEKLTGKIMAVATAWDMEIYSPRWREAGVGITQIEVQPSLRRKGLAKFLLDQLLHHLQDQCFLRTQVMITPNDTAAATLFKGLGFQRVDTGHSYRLTEAGSHRPTS